MPRRDTRRSATSEVKPEELPEAESEEAAGNSTPEPAISTGELARRLDDLLAAEATRRPLTGVWYFFSSGVFFMLVGAAALFAAFSTMGTTHASFTFVLVVVGVAILLYGTGTQGVGNFETAAGEMKYKIGIAGGAGILAFAVGMGIVTKANEIRDAFQIEKKYARLIFRDPGDGVGSLVDYVPAISVDGVPVPSQRNGDYIVAYVPLLATPGDRELLISANFYYVGSQTANKLLSQKVTLRQNLPLKSDQITMDDAGFDFPRLRSEVTVKLVADAVVNDPDKSQRDSVGAADDPTENEPPPVNQSFE